MNIFLFKIKNNDKRNTYFLKCRSYVNTFVFEYQNRTLKKIKNKFNFDILCISTILTCAISNQSSFSIKKCNKPIVYFYFLVNYTDLQQNIINKYISNHKKWELELWTYSSLPVSGSYFCKLLLQSVQFIEQYCFSIFYFFQLKIAIQPLGTWKSATNFMIATIALI